jgi:hypothetical protein
VKGMVTWFSIQRVHSVLSGLLLLTTSLPMANAEGWRDTLFQPHSIQARDGDPWAQLSVLADLTAYAADEPPPGLLFDADGSFIQPRLGLLLDAGVGQRLTGHLHLQFDRGFDPGHKRQGDIRFDEYYVQASVIDAARLQLRVGKFVTAFGGWVNRHRSGDNPLVSAPVPYEDMTTITDQAVPVAVGGFVNRRNLPEIKSGWLPVVWGPSYATGVSVSGGLGDFDVVVEVKNASISSRPETWDAVEEGFTTDPTYTGRIAWHPMPEWTLGLSHSRGPYLQDTTRRLLPADKRVNDYEQTTTGLELTFERRRLQLWAEIMHSTFEVPRVGDAELLTGFVEVRYKFAPRWWLAGRWNRSIFDEVRNSTRSWDRHLTRIDVGVGFRQDANLLFKLEYNRGQQSGGNINGRDQVAVQAVLAF